MTPAWRRSSAISINAAVKRLGFSVFVICHLLQGFILQCLSDPRFVGRQPGRADLSQGQQFVRTDVLALILCEAIQKNRPSAGAISDDHLVTAGAALPGSRDTLLDDATTQIGIDKPTLRPLDGLPQAFVRNPFTPREPRKPLGCENPHGLP